MNSQAKPIDLTNIFIEQRLGEKPNQRIIRKPLSEIDYFYHKDKYTCAVYKGGELVLDSAVALRDIELAYGHAFLRVHRDTLVAKRAIHEAVINKEGGRVYLHGYSEGFRLSRREAVKARPILQVINIPVIWGKD